MSGLGKGYQFYSWAYFMFGLACRYFMGAIVAGANVMEPIFPACQVCHIVIQFYILLSISRGEGYCFQNLVQYRELLCRFIFGQSN